MIDKELPLGAKNRLFMAYSMQPNKEMLDGIFRRIMDKNGLGYLL